MSDLEDISNYLKAIADPTRLRIVSILANHKNPLCVNAIANSLNVTQSAVSQHLRILKQVGLVSGVRQGYHIHYNINAENFEQYNTDLHHILFPPADSVKDYHSGDCLGNKK